MIFSCPLQHCFSVTCRLWVSYLCFSLSVLLQTLHYSRYLTLTTGSTSIYLCTVNMLLFSSSLKALMATKIIRCCRSSDFSSISLTHTSFRNLNVKILEIHIFVILCPDTRLATDFHFIPMVYVLLRFTKCFLLLECCRRSPVCTEIRTA